MSAKATDPIARFEQLLVQRDFIFVVYYRGHWCPFCRQFLCDLEKLAPSIARKNGKILAVTAEEGKHLSAMRSASGFNCEALVDTEHHLANKLREEALLDVAVTSKAGYSNGMAQPAVLVIKKDRTTIFRWECVPSTMNLGGATDRPVLLQVWENAEAQLDHREVVHKKIQTTRALGVLGSRVASFFK